ncbi:hypothetical protein [Pseudoflavitalea rhizosphaerae]|uniref:hypothetical protein n=1 Tax=Pseudoflavitalea rhizosphaerae TaxID=1884793 RepID=UPI000F8DED39|nr:hypothetical protein [Pseudoflavitalea rhizosphaerae]
MKTAPSFAQNRLQVVPILAQKFMRDMEEVIEPFNLSAKVRIIEHLMQMVQGFSANPSDELITEKWQANEEVLIKEFGKTFMPFVNKHFHEYFYRDSVILHKDVYPIEEYNQLKPADTVLSESEYQSLLQMCGNLLFNAKRFLYLSMEPAPTVVPNQASLPAETETEEADKVFTKARQLLAVYILLKAGFNVEHRDGQSVADVARLAHLLTGTKFTTIQNSDIYKKYRLMPEYKQGAALLNDLTFIRPFFEAIQLESACGLIDEMKASTEKKLKRK